MGKILPFKDSFLTFYNYKEPLRKVEGGFGYMGALLGSIDGNTVQCHICGELFSSLPRHIASAHAKLTPTARAYKERFGLAYSTSLISEATREKRKMTMIRAWASYSPVQLERARARVRKHAENWQKRRAENKRRQPKHTLETKNKRGTCPDQLLDKLVKASESIGHTPSLNEFLEYCGGSQRYTHLLRATFGSWANAIKKAGLSERVHKKAGRPNPKTNEELLDALSVFYQENNKIPSYTDCKRGLLPDENIYTRRFGSMKKARKLAGILEEPTRYSHKK